MRIPTAFLVLASLTAPATASEVISFDEIAPFNTNRMILSEEYAHLGVHFSATDEGAIWGGVSNGNPGGWGLEGTNGPAFVGFNGRTYMLTATFDEPVPAFHVDLSAASGSALGSVFALQGYRSGALVETASATLGGLNEWTTVALTAPVDQVVFVGDTRGFRPFGADNMGWGIDAPARIDVAIDVRPDSAENPVNPGSNGMLPVALLGSESFDVEIVDPISLALGVNGAPAAATEYADANGDGWIDLVGHFRTHETGTAYGDTSICLAGVTLDDVDLAGCDAIRTVPQSPGAQKKAQQR